jgi:glycosyltransferase involved in cell wall biosynthesis
MLVIGTVGRLTPVKGQRALLQAVAIVRNLRPDLYRRLRVLIVGDGPLRRELADLVAQLELAASTWLPGDRNDVPVLLQAMDVFVLPSLAEGISNTVLEAMATGLPVVATAVGGNLELVEEGFNGSLVPVGDPPALAQALIPLLEVASERARLGANARRRVGQRFDWKRTVSSYLGVYDGLLQLPAGERIESNE